MTFDPYLWPLTSWICVGSYIFSKPSLVQSHFNFSNELNSAFRAHILLDLWWPLILLYFTAWTYKCSYIISINQVWVQSDFNFSNEATFTFSYILQLDLKQPLTLICNLRPHQQMRVPMLHLWSNFGWNTSSMPCGSYSQILHFSQRKTTVDKTIPTCLSSWGSLNKFQT